MTIVNPDFNKKLLTKLFPEIFQNLVYNGNAKPKSQISDILNDMNPGGFADVKIGRVSDRGDVFKITFRTKESSIKLAVMSWRPINIGLTSYSMYLNIKDENLWCEVGRGFDLFCATDSIACDLSKGSLSDFLLQMPYRFDAPSATQQTIRWQDRKRAVADYAQQLLKKYG